MRFLSHSHSVCGPGDHTLGAGGGARRLGQRSPTGLPDDGIVSPLHGPAVALGGC